MISLTFSGVNKKCVSIKRRTPVNYLPIAAKQNSLEHSRIANVYWNTENSQKAISIISNKT